MNTQQPFFSFHLIHHCSAQCIHAHQAQKCKLLCSDFFLVVKESCAYFNAAGYPSCYKKAFSKTAEGKLHVWVTGVQVTAAETDFQWLLVNLKTRISHQLPLWRAPTFLYASVTCHLESWRCTRFQNQMGCVNQCWQSNKPNIRRFAQVVVSPYKVQCSSTNLIVTKELLILIHRIKIIFLLLLSGKDGHNLWPSHSAHVHDINCTHFRCAIVLL